MANTPEKPTVLLLGNMARTIYKHRLPLLISLRSAGYRVIVAAPFDESVGALLDASGATFVALQHFQRNSLRPWQALRSFLELLHLIRVHRPAIVLPFGIQCVLLGGPAAQRMGVASISVITGLGYSFLHPGWIHRTVRSLLRIALRPAVYVVFENTDDLEWMRASKLIRSDQAVLIPGSGIDLKFFQPETAEKAHNKIIFTFIGRLLYDKGLREFAGAAALIQQSCPHAECWIVGPVDVANPAHVHQKELLQWVQNGILHYKGVVDDVRPVIAQSDWIVLPSYREGLSRVLLEAMAMEKPLITTDTPGCRETVETGRNGFLVPVKDTPALAEAMLHCTMLPPDEIKQMGARSREKAAQEFDSERINATYLALIKNCLTAKLK